MNAPSTEILRDWVADPSLALSDIGSLFAALSSEELDEGEVAEVFENCGAPSATHLATLVNFLKCDENDESYWAATLIGRMESAANSAQQSLVELLANPKRVTKARQRSAWALQRIGPLNRSTLEALQHVDASSDPRLQRLIDEFPKQLA